MSRQDSQQRPVTASSDIPNLFRRFNIDTRRGNFEYYCQEFSYSTIYGNLKMANLHQIMELIGIRQLPDIMFLVQADNQRDIYEPYPEFNAFPRKASIVLSLKNRLDALGIQGVVADFTGRDTIGAYLRLEGSSLRDNATRTRVEKLAADLIDCVRQGTGESISIGVSDFCLSYARFPQAYVECKEALAQNFRCGKGAYSIFSNPDRSAGGASRLDLRGYLTRFITAIDANDSTALRRFAEDITCDFRQSALSPVNIRLHLSSIVGRLADHYIDEGLDGEALQLLSFHAMRGMLSLSFLQNAPRVFNTLAEGIWQTRGAMGSKRLQFKQQTDMRIAEGYAHSGFGLREIAAQSGYSPSYFSRLFTKTYGLPFRAYMADYRLGKAKELLLRRDLSLEDVAVETGFRSASYFCAVFKKHIGVSPRHFIDAQK